MILVEIIIVLFSAIAIYTLILGDWNIHISQNKHQRKPYGWGNYKQFVREFEKYDGWVADSHWRKSFFPEKYSNYEKYYIHADIIIFDGKCMNLYPLSYYRVQMYLKKKWIEMSGIKKIKWD